MSKMFCVFFVCVVAGLAAAPARADDDVVGAIWRTEREDGTKAKLVFRAGPKGIVWTVPEKGLPVKIGTWKGDAEKTVMTIDPAQKGQKRTISIVLVEKKPPAWKGEVELADGTKHPLKVTLVKD